MDEEKRCLFIQQRINLLSGHNENSLFHHNDSDNGTGDGGKTSKKTRKVELTGKEDQERLEICGRLAQIVDLNLRQEHDQQFGTKVNGQRKKVKGHHTDRTFQALGDDNTGIIFGSENRDLNEKCVAKELVNRLKTERILYLAKEANRAEIHDPKKCKSCRKQEEKIAEYEFLKRQKTKLESAALDRKIDDVVHTTDTVLMIGDLARTLPKPSEDRKIIWDKLLKKHQS